VKRDEKSNSRRTRLVWGVVDSLLIAIATFAAFAMTLKLWWWQDDFALLFKMQHITEGAGYFGPGVWGGGPYRGLVAPIYPFFKSFGLEPLGYFAIALGIRALGAVAMYWVSRLLFRERLLAFVSALVVATTTASSDTMLRIQNSYQSFLGLTVVLATTAAAILSFRAHGWKRVAWYLISFGLLWASLEGFYVRSHGAALALATFTMIFLAARSWKAWLEIGLRLIPIILLFRTYYLSDTESGNRIGMLVSFMKENPLEAFTTPLVTFGNTLMPNTGADWISHTLAASGPLIAPLSLGALALVWLWLIPLAGRTRALIVGGVVILGAAGYAALARVQTAQDAQILLPLLVFSIGALTTIITFGVHFWKNERGLGRIILASLAWIGASFLIYYAQYPSTFMDHRHRYLIYALPAIGWLLASIVWLAAKTHKKPAWLFSGIVLVIVAGSIIGNTRYFSHIAATRSAPTEQFYAALQDAIPTIPKGSIVYLASAPDPLTQEHIKQFFSVGSMPNATAIAIWYGIDRYDFTFVEGVDEFLAETVKQNVPLEQLFVLGYSAEGGLKDYSAGVREILGVGKTIALAPSWKGETKIDFEHGRGVQPLFEKTGLDLVGILPALVTGTARIEPLPDTQLPDPYADVSVPTETASLETLLSRDPATLTGPIEKAFRFLAARAQFRHTAQITTQSQWRGQEREYLIDGDRQTTWLGHRIEWHERSSETITITLKDTQSIEGLYWVNGHKTRTPTRYVIEGKDGDGTWNGLARVEKIQELPSGAEQIDRFPAKRVGQIRLTIEDTLEHDAPSLGEIFPIPEGLADVDLTTAGILEERPFGASLSREERKHASAYVKEQGAQILGLYNVDRRGWRSEQMAHASVPVGESAAFEILLPGGSQLLEGIRLTGFSVPAHVEITNLTLHYPTLTQLKEKKLIKTFSEN